MGTVSVPPQDLGPTSSPTFENLYVTTDFTVGGNHVAAFNQVLNTTSDVTFHYVQANRDYGFQLTGVLNAYWYYGLYAMGTNGALLETDAGLDIAFRPGGGTQVLLKSNGQIVFGGTAPSGSNILTVIGDASISGPLTCLGVLSGTAGNWETGAANHDILWSNTYINSTYYPDMDGTGIGSKFRQYYYDATTPAAADIGSQKWVTEGDWTATASTRNSTMVLQNVKSGVLQDVLSIDSNKAATFSGTIAATNLTSGTYAPTRSAEVNLDSSVTVTTALYSRVGNTVSVSGQFTADPTLTTTNTSFELTLPIASNLAQVYDLNGTAFCGAISGQGAQITGSVANNTAVITWKAVDVTAQTWSYQYSYLVI